MIDYDRLHNWGRWCRVWTRRGRAASLEGNYRPGRSEDEKEGPTIAKASPPDIWDAWDVEIGCRLLEFRRHLFLKLMFVARLDGPGICREMRGRAGERMTVRDLDAFEAMSVVMLSDAMEAPAVVRMARARRRVQEILAPYLDEQLV